MYNTIQIKRRLASSSNTGIPTLSGGELAYNEKTDELYYGSENGTITIAGSGAFVDRVTDQTISGNKTFSSLTTLSSTTFSSSSLIDAGGNKITNLAEPLNSSDAITKNYADTNFQAISSSSTTGLSSLSAVVYNTFVKLTDDRAVDLSGGLTVTNGVTADTLYTSSNASVGGNLTVTGNLSVLGTQTVINTQTINISGISTQIDVVNNGTATGITVNQTGSENVAEFYDDSAIALAIVDGGSVGIGTLTPNEKLTVAGSVSASGDIYANNGTLTGTLNVSQGATFASTLSVASAVDFDSTLDVVGATTFQSTLDVTSGATFFANVSGQAGVSTLIDFIIDGGEF